MRHLIVAFALAALPAGAAFAQPAPQITAEEIIQGLTGGTGDATGAGAGAGLGLDRGVCFGTTEQCAPGAAAGAAAAGAAAASTLPATGSAGTDLPASGTVVTSGLPATGLPATGTPATGTVSGGVTAPPPAVNLLITFHFGSDRLTDQAMSNLREFARAIAMPELAGARFSIDGHTDAVGSDGYNRELSMRRARAVAAFLESLGVEGARLVPTGHGETRLYDASNPEADINRRVEASILRP